MPFTRCPRKKLVPRVERIKGIGEKLNIKAYKTLKIIMQKMTAKTIIKALATFGKFIKYENKKNNE
jgi:hypothetical protein